MVKGGRVRVYVGTRKGLYVAESDPKRKKYKIAGPHRPGGDVFHVAPDPRKPGTAYAAVNSGWFGPMMFRSTDGGKKWKEIGTPMMAMSKKRPPPTGDPREEKRPVANLWHIAPGPENEPNRVYLGIDPASLFVSNDKGNSWEGMAGLNEHPTRPKWNPGAGGMCLHTILQDPERPRRMYVGISAAGTFRSDDGGESFRPVNKGVVVSFQPDKTPVVGQCVHKVAFDQGDSSTIYRQDHDGIHVSHDAMESWKRVGKALSTDFGFVVASPKAQPGTAYFVPLEGMSRMIEGGSFQVVRWTEKDRKFAPMVKKGAFPGGFGTHREGMAADDLDPAGIYVGTNTGALFTTPDAGRSWMQVPYSFPPIHSVTVESL